MDEDDEDMVGWEDDDQEFDGEGIAWEDGGGDRDGDGGEGIDESVEFEVDNDADEEPEERRWLGDDGEIVVELPRGQDEDVGDGGDEDDSGGDGESGASGRGKGKEKAKARRFTAEEIRLALGVHKVHLACLVARCAMVSRWAGDPIVQAAMVSCLPSHLLSKVRLCVPLSLSPSSVFFGNQHLIATKYFALAKQSMLIGQQQREMQGLASAANENSGEEQEVNRELTLVDLVVWFRGFLTVLDDGAVGGSGGKGGGGEGSWGSRPARLLRVIEQRAGCAQEAVQLFVSLCRGLGLRARYVACLDPVPPFPSVAGPPPPPFRSSKRTKNNTVDLTGAEDQQHHRPKRRRGMGESECFRATGLERTTASSQAWAEVLCRDGDELYVVAKEEGASRSGQPPPAATSRHLLKRQRIFSSPSPPLLSESCQPANRARAEVSGKPLSARSCSSSSNRDGDEDTHGTAVKHSGGTSSMSSRRRSRSRTARKQPQVEEDHRQQSKTPAGGPGTGRPEVGVAAAAPAPAESLLRPPARAGSKRKAAAAKVTKQSTTNGGRPQKGPNKEAAAAAADADADAAETKGEKEGSKGACDGGRTSAADPVDDRTGAGADVAGAAAANGVGGGSSSADSRRDGGSESGGAGGDVAKAVSSPPAGVVVRERWVHVDPVEGAVDQADKVQDLRFRKRLMPYVVAEDENQLIVDVTRRYSSEWARTLRARGRLMASSDGWWNRALRLWGAAAADGRRSNGRKGQKNGTGTAASPLLVEGEGDDSAVDDPRDSEERELQEKVNSEPVPSTIAALKNHHVYVLGKELLKFEGLRPGARAAGLVKGSKVYLKTDVAKLRGASRWKMDGLQVRESEVGKPAKVATKNGKKEGEGTSKLYGEWQTESWVPEAAANGKVPKNEYGNVEFFDCSPAFLPPGTEHVQGDQVGRVAARLGVDYAPALTGFETKQGRQVPVLDGIIVCKEHSQMLREAHVAWQQTILEKKVKARGQRVLRRWSTLFRGVLVGAQLLDEYGGHD
ncbi:unnamed protein product [Pylaiella littoralis]